VTVQLMLYHSADPVNRQTTILLRADGMGSLFRFFFAVAVLALVQHDACAADSAATGNAAAVKSLRDRLASLSNNVRRDEAERLAGVAYRSSGSLAREYRVLGPPLFHNFLVNAGVKKRGLCHEWARDLMSDLRALKLRTFDLHWGTARAGTLREHNAVVVTAKRQPFASGIVLDPWRRSGRLFAGPVAGDRYPWKEDLNDCFCARRIQR
jgi:hypothetical protein